jgi:hypothetical protein
LAPVAVRMTDGRPAAIAAKLRLPPVSLLTSWSRRARCRSEVHPARLRGGDGAHRSMKRICIVEETHWHSGSFAEIEPTPSRIATFIDACPGA